MRGALFFPERFYHVAQGKERTVNVTWQVFPTASPSASFSLPNQLHLHVPAALSLPHIPSSVHRIPASCDKVLNLLRRPNLFDVPLGKFLLLASFVGLSSYSA